MAKLLGTPHIPTGERHREGKFELLKLMFALRSAMGSGGDRWGETPGLACARACGGRG